MLDHMCRHHQLTFMFLKEHRMIVLIDNFSHNYYADLIPRSLPYCIISTVLSVSAWAYTRRIAVLLHLYESELRSAQRRRSVSDISWRWTSDEDRASTRQPTLRFMGSLISSPQARGNYFLTGGSKPRGPHFEESTNLLQMITKNALLDLVSEYNILM